MDEFADELLRYLQSGNARALHVLLSDYRNPLAAYFCVLGFSLTDAIAVAVGVFDGLLESAKGYQPGRIGVRAWLFAQARLQYSEARYNAGTALQATVPATHHEIEMEPDEEAFFNRFRHLPAVWREAIHLTISACFTRAEAAYIIGVSESEIQAWITSACEELEQDLVRRI